MYAHFFCFGFGFVDSSFFPGQMAQFLFSSPLLEDYFPYIAKVFVFINRDLGVALCHSVPFESLCTRMCYNSVREDILDIFREQNMQEKL